MTQHTSAVRDQRKTAVVLTAGLSALLMLAWLAVGQTRAAFTDTTDNPGNFFTTGSVDLTATENADAWFDTAALDLLPGNSVTGSILVQNNSPVPLGVRLFGADYSVTEGSEIADKLNLLVTVDGANGGTVFDGTMAEFAAATEWANGCSARHPAASCGTASAATAPGAPAAPTATAGNAQISVDFDPPANDGGSPITGYTATCTSSGTGAQGTANGAGSPLIVSNLTNGEPYTCTVKATNNVGTSPASGASNEVTPEETAPEVGPLETLLRNQLADEDDEDAPVTEGDVPAQVWAAIAAADTAAWNAQQAAEGAGEQAQETVQDPPAPAPAEVWAQVRPQLEENGVPATLLEAIDTIVALSEDGEEPEAAGAQAANAEAAEEGEEDRVAPKDLGDTLQASMEAGSSRTYTFTVTMASDAGSANVKPEDSVNITFVWEGRA